MLTTAFKNTMAPVKPMSWTEAILVSLAAVAAVAAALAIAVAIYLAKSEAGINLMPGPSPLHDVLYPLAR